MKTQYTLFLGSIPILILCACGEAGNSNKHTSSVPLSLSQDTCAARDTQLIDTTKMLNYLLSYTQKPLCGAFVNAFGWGNYYPLNDFALPLSEEDSTAGLFIYHCLDSTNNNGFCALRLGNLCNPEDETVFNLSPTENLTVSSSKIDFTLPANTTRAQIADYLKSTTLSGTYLRYVPDTVLGSLVTIKRQSYKNYYLSEPLYTNVCSGFFNAAEFNLFASQKIAGYKNITGFVILRGFDHILGCEKIRTILVPVDEDGKYMIAQETLIMERSWPPPRPKKDCN